MIEKFLEHILKDSLFPIIVEACYKSGSETWQYNKFVAIIIFLIGFIFTKIGNLILIMLIILFILKKKKII